jgi:hypothetical protein
LFATAVVGLVGGHLLGYVLLTPNPAERASLLARTGHGYLPKVVILAMGAAVLAGIAAAILGAARARSRTGPLGVRGTTLRLAVLQVAGYILLEVLERLLAGHPLGHLTAALLLGIPLQVLVAAVGGLVLSLVARAAQALARALGRRPTRRLQPAPLRPFPVERALPHRPFPAPRVIRGPPSLETA